ncbi:MAG: Tetratricopeptide repeat protein, partial [Akkermansiaceae bacterium]|nr:Tetratricopeptide repeat protein [Akkermansiaceae bacterium]
MNPAIADRFSKLAEADKAGQSAYARHLGEALLAIDPGHVLALLIVADQLIVHSQYEKASQIFDRLEAIALPEKKRYRLLVLRGELLEKRGDYAGALSEFVKAHELRPALASPLIYASSCAFQNGDLEQALDLACRASACPEGCIDEALFNQGGYLVALKRYEEARPCYVQSLAMD